MGRAAIEDPRVPSACVRAYPKGEATRTDRLKSGAVDLIELATRSAHRDFRPTNRLSERPFLRSLRSFAAIS